MRTNADCVEFVTSSRETVKLQDVITKYRT